jgi:imidazolonepropionase
MNDRARVTGSLVVTGIGELLTMRGDAADPLGRVTNAALVVDGGRVVWAGRESDLDRAACPKDARAIDAGGRLVTPGLVEPHAHPIFAGSRAAEFDLRARGKSYAEILAAGGGIHATVAATRAATDDELIDSTVARLDRLLAHGVTVCEAKSGYALDVAGERRLLFLLYRVKLRHPIDLSPTLLAHVPPPDADRAAFVAGFVDGLMLPRHEIEGMVEGFDVFCDRGAFTLDESRALLERARSHGLLLRVHAEQLSHTGAARLAAEMHARSAEHLEQLAADDIPLLGRAGVVCTLMPGAALTLRLPFPDARRLLDGGCTVALGTDLNPGSSHTESLPLMMSIACMQMGMSCAEAWQAVTVNAAHALDRADAGRLTPGARGDLVLWSTDDHREVCQHYGVNLVERVAIRGRLVHPAEKGVGDRRLRD